MIAKNSPVVFKAESWNFGA